MGRGKQWEWRRVESSLHPSSIEGVLNFNRVITEEMVDDILHLVSFSVQTLESLE